LPFAIKEIQTDNGQEFSDRFRWHLENIGIEHRKTKVRSPEENGKVERSHRTDEEEFYRTKRFVSIGHCIGLLKQGEKEYNEERPHMALKGKTPKEYLLEKLQNHVLTKIKSMSIKTVAEAG
jgi:transposase InsO family protein